MAQKKHTDIHDLIEQAIQSLEAEIKTVREQPSSTVLFNGTLEKGSSSKKKSSSSPESSDYKFESQLTALRFAEEIQAKNGSDEWTVHPVSWSRNEIVLRFPEKAGETIPEIQLEWENDFVLRRTLEELERLSAEKEHVLDRIRLLFNPQRDQTGTFTNILGDGMRNEAQSAAILKSMQYPTVYIWGPPGTGKTATLGYIVANDLNRGRRVLLVSNTNRAVDVGLLNTLQALEQIGYRRSQHSVTRFGEAVLEVDEIHNLMFDRQIEQIGQQRREEALKLSSLLDRTESLTKAMEEQLSSGKKPEKNLQEELELLLEEIRGQGGREQLEEQIESLLSVNERAELMKKQLVATTLAKTCTSDLFFNLEFDTVVIDEGSMASLPSMIIAAARARHHRIIVGDPMQLPPIAVTKDREAREFLEQDLFTTVSAAESTEELFDWHDRNPEFTSFFDVQYRLEPALADVISSVFYEGRLKSQKAEDPALSVVNSRAYHLIDTSRYQPVLTQKREERGFHPVNLVHQEVLERLTGNMLKKGIHPSDIGILLPFRSPVYDLRQRLTEAGMGDIEIGTVHTFQGREKPYIIFDTVMSGEHQYGKTRHYSVRPLDEEKNGLSVPRLLNVAFSRSQKELMILADMQHIHQVYGEKFLGRLLKRMQNGKDQ